MIGDVGNLAAKWQVVTKCLSFKLNGVLVTNIWKLLDTQPIV